jgi:hypothetical protein
LWLLASNVLPQLRQQFQEVIDFRLPAQVIAGMGVLFSANAHRYHVAFEGESIFIVLIVA